jgi:hypothetical protein
MDTSKNSLHETLSNDSALVPLSFVDVHARGVRGCHRNQFFQLPGSSIGGKLGGKAVQVVGVATSSSG